MGMPQQNNLVGGGTGLSHHNQMISHVQGFSASGGSMALRSKNKHWPKMINRRQTLPQQSVYKQKSTKNNEWKGKRAQALAPR